MRLNGIHADPGTIVGVHFRTKRLLTVVSNDDEGVVVRYATAEEVTAERFKHEPRSVAEHRAIARRMSPYGLIRQYAPQPRPVVEYRPTEIVLGDRSSIPNRSARRRHQKFIHELHGRKRS